MLMILKYTAIKFKFFFKWREKKKKKVSLTHKIDDRSFHKKLKNILFIVGLTEGKKNYCKKKNSR